MMQKLSVAISFFGAILAAVPAAAQHAPGFEVSAAAGYHTYGSATELDGALGGAARLGFWFWGPFSLEGEFHTAKPRTTASSGEQVTVNSFAGWLLGNLPVGERGSVFLKSGFGTTDYGNCPDVAIPGSGPCGAVGVLQGGAGARIEVIRNVAVRIDGVINTSTSSRKFSNAIVQGGVSILLGSRSRSPAPVDGDPDGDGVKESRDRCPGTPRGSRVDAIGCSIPETAPAPAPAAAPVVPPATGKPAAPPVDSARNDTTVARKDSVVARKDTTVVRKDSVAPQKDPAAPKPSVKDRVVILPGTIWNYRATTINATGMPRLDSLVTALKQNVSLVAEIQGYAHDRLVPSDNTLLSQRRAEAIKTYMVSKGVTAERLTAVGLGSQTLIVSDTTDAARITNRRVEVHLRPKP